MGRKEGEVFLELLKNPNSNGSQIAKNIGISKNYSISKSRFIRKKRIYKSYLDKEITYYEVINLDDFFNEQKKKSRRFYRNFKR